MEVCATPLPLKPLSIASSARGRPSVKYRQSTLAECLDAWSSSPSTSDGEAKNSKDKNSSSPTRSSKRRKLGKPSSDAPAPSSDDTALTVPSSQAYGNERKEEIVHRRSQRAPKRSLAFQLESLSLASKGFAQRRCLRFGMQSYLETLVSSATHDRIPLTDPDDPDIRVMPYTLAFSNSAKQGRKGWLAVGDNAGDVHFLTMAAQDEEPLRFSDPSPTDFHLEAHDNAVFTVAFSSNDRYFATGSGDFRCGIFDTTADYALVGMLSGHQGSPRSITFAPDDERIVVTGARDGSIAVWDLRMQGINAPPESRARDAYGNDLAYAQLVIRNAHDDLYERRRGRRPFGAALPSIAGAALLPQNTKHLVSAAGGDGTVKLWDLRSAKSLASKVHPAAKERSAGHLGGPAPVWDKGRGVIRMILSPEGDRVYTLGMDSVIRAYDPNFLSQPSGHLPTWSHPKLLASSFYVPLALSPCSRFIGAGTTTGDLVLFDTQAPSSSSEDLSDASTSTSASPGVYIQGGHGKKETGAMDWTHDGLATAGDDGLIRRWRFDRKVATQIKEVGTETMRRQWSGVYSRASAPGL